MNGETSFVFLRKSCTLSDVSLYQWFKDVEKIVAV